LNKVQFLLI